MPSPELPLQQYPQRRRESPTPIPLPENTGEKMVITSGKEFDPTMQGGDRNTVPKGRIQGYVDAEGSFESALKSTQNVEKTAAADEEKYFKEMTLILGSQRTVTEKTQELDKRLKYFESKLQNTIVANDANAKKHYDSLIKTADGFKKEVGYITQMESLMKNKGNISKDTAELNRFLLWTNRRLEATQSDENLQKHYKNLRSIATSKLAENRSQ
jgi:hypothetical protein